MLGLCCRSPVACAGARPAGRGLAKPLPAHAQSASSFKFDAARSRRWLPAHLFRAGLGQARHRSAEAAGRRLRCLGRREERAQRSDFLHPGRPRIGWAPSCTAPPPCCSAGSSSRSAAIAALNYIYQLRKDERGPDDDAAGSEGREPPVRRRSQSEKRPAGDGAPAHAKADAHRSADRRRGDHEPDALRRGAEIRARARTRRRCSWPKAKARLPAASRRSPPSTKCR